jgi:hypothetical protein
VLAHASVWRRLLFCENNCGKFALLAYNKEATMDFLDPVKQKAHARRLALGYALIGLMLLLGTTVLLYKAYGFGIDRNGRVIQNGLVFFSSQPEGADIYLNGQKRDTTNTRLSLPSGAYTVELKREGYRTWKRALTVEGGSLERFDYQLLFPTSLATSVTHQYTAAPGMTMQSNDRRWLLLQHTQADQFELFDLGVDEPAAKIVTVPSDIYTPSSTTKSWTPIRWADDNRHALLKRGYEKNGQAGSEYILLDRERPEASTNLSSLFGFTPATIEFRNQKFDQYYLYDDNSDQVFTTTIKEPTPQPILKDVLAFQSDDDVVLYATPDTNRKDKVAIKLYQDEQIYSIRQVPTSPVYLLELARYGRTWFVAAGVPSEDKVYVYKDPIGILKDKTNILAPTQSLKIDDPTYVSFSKNGRFAMAQHDNRFAVYDAETDKGYVYQAKAVMDAPQIHASWMDGFRLQMVNAGKLTVFDYDGTNVQNLQPINPTGLPFFAPDYRYVYALTTQHALTSTALRTERDL